MKKIIGVIGGMGSLATVDLFNKIVTNTNAIKDQDHLHIIIDNNPNISDRTSFILKEVGAQNPLQELIKSAKRLRDLGADKLIMPCNTAHYFLEDIEKETNVKFISIIETTVSKIRDDYKLCKNVAVISTTGTKKTKLYENCLNKYSYNVIDFDDSIQKDITACIYDGVKQGRILEYVELFQSVVEKIENMKADIIIAACTEIPILVGKIKTNKIVVDPTLELAKKTIEYVSNES